MPFSFKQDKDPEAHRYETVDALGGDFTMTGTNTIRLF